MFKVGTYFDEFSLTKVLLSRKVQTRSSILCLKIFKVIKDRYVLHSISRVFVTTYCFNNEFSPFTRSSPESSSSNLETKSSTNWSSFRTWPLWNPFPPPVPWLPVEEVDELEDELLLDCEHEGKEPVIMAAVCKLMNCLFLSSSEK